MSTKVIKRMPSNATGIVLPTFNVPGIISSFVDLVNLKHADCVAKHPIPQVSSMLVNKPIRASVIPFLKWISSLCLIRSTIRNKAEQIVNAIKTILSKITAFILNLQINIPKYCDKQLPGRSHPDNLGNLPAFLIL